MAEYQDTLTSYLINASAEGHGTVEGSKAAIRGDFAKLTAKPDSGYRFVGWYDKDAIVYQKNLSSDSEYWKSRTLLPNLR